jgi:hypothetical protein
MCSPVVLDCEPRGGRVAPAIPAVAFRAGIDLNPLDVTDERDVAWLRALLWPEHTDRLALLNAAIEVARREPPRLHGDDVFECLPRLVAEAPPGAAVCLVATFVLNQFSDEMRGRLRALMLELSPDRELHHVQIGFPGFLEPGSQLDGVEQGWVLRVSGGLGRYRAVAVANPHGRWIEWLEEGEWKEW